MKILTILALIFAASTANAGSTWSGKVTHVRDADTIEVTDRRGRTVAVRLNGIDAPELDESGGRAGKKWVTQKWHGEQMTCELTGKKTYDRLVGSCFDKVSTDIVAAIIAAGHGQDCPRYSKQVRHGGYSEFNTKIGVSRPLKNYCR